MEYRVIKIRKPSGGLRGFFETLKSLFSRFSAWLLGSSDAAPTKRPALRTIERKTLPPPASDNGNSVIRIRTRLVSNSTEAQDSPPAPVKTTARPGRGPQRKKQRINVDVKVRICKACGEGFNDSDAKSRCLNDSKHFVHKRCTEIMKNKCPYCGGRLT